MTVTMVMMMMLNSFITSHRHHCPRHHHPRYWTSTRYPQFVALHSLASMHELMYESYKNPMDIL